MPDRLFTHKGWFGFCPIYIANLEAEGPTLAERHWSLTPLFTLSHWMFVANFWLMDLLGIEHEPGWPIKITGEI